MSSSVTIKKMDQEGFDEFQSLYHFCANEDDPGHNQGLFSISSFTYFLLVDNKPIAAFGAIILWKGVAECWLMGSPHIGTYRLSVIKALKSLTNQMLTAGLHRIQIYVKDTPMMKKWAELLGFTFEGVLRKHALDGSDNLIYSKIWD